MKTLPFLNPQSWSIRAKLVLFSVVISGGSIATLGFMATNAVSNSVTELKEQSLVSIMNERSGQLTQKLAVVQDEIVVLSSNTSIQHAATEFNSAFNSLSEELHASDSKNPVNTGDMDNYLDQVFGSKLRDEGRTYRGSKAYTPKSKEAQEAQRMYIAQNKNPAGSKQQLDRAPEDISYNTVHAKHHPYLRNYVERLGYYDLFILNQSGDIIYSVFKETDYATNVVNGPFASTGISNVFQAAKSASEGEFRLVEFGSYEPSYGAPAWFIASPLFLDGERVGVVCLQIPTDYISEILGNPIGKTGQTIMIGKDMKLRSEMPNNPDAIVLETALVNDATKAAIAGQSGTMMGTDFRNESVLSAYQPLPIEGIDWYLIATIDKSEVMEPAVSMARGIMFNGLIVACIVIPLGFLFARSIAKPIAMIVQGVQNLADGKLNTRIDLTRHDELGELSTAVNTMAGTLSTLISEVQIAASEVASTATEIASGAEQMSSGMEHQRGQTAQVSAAVEQMSVSVSEVAHKSSDASQKSIEGGEQAIKGGKTVHETIAGMNAISEQVNESVASVAELGKCSEQIGEVIAVINDIADQTNLLALNAAIEAARAGEHGRGFAVVADEVRKLAERTTNATKEVGESIQSIQTETKLAIERMEAGRDRVNDGVHLAEDAGIALEQIVTGSNEIVPMIQEIAAAAEEQSVAANEIAINIEQIDSVTNESSQAVSKVAGAAVELSEKAELLQNLVHKFEI